MRVNSAGETTWDNVWNLVSAAALLFAADAQLCMFLPLSAGACWKWSERMNVWLRVRETQVNHRTTEAERQRALLNTTLQWARSLHTRAHKLLTHNTSSPFSYRTQRKEQERRERQTRSERESEGEGVREERRGEGELWAVREDSMASDSGLAAMLLWTISLQGIGTARGSSNEGKWAPLNRRR